MSAHGFSRQNFTFLDGVKNDHHGMSHHIANESRLYIGSSRDHAPSVGNGPGAIAFECCSRALPT